MIKKTTEKIGVQVDIRPSQSREIALLVGLYNLMWTDSTNPLTIKTGEQLVSAIKKNPDNELFVAVLDGRIVGAFVLLLERHSGRAVIDNVAVHPRYRRRGVGRSIVDFAVERCRDENCRWLVHPMSERRDDSFDFYRELGFDRRGYELVLGIEKARRSS